ncbi:MAG TPA: hypothetical protein VN886_18005 [Acidimicrobiales bacterium]|nr:hypothetical protein [Acidimicrobiales bacterium]
MTVTAAPPAATARHARRASVTGRSTPSTLRLAGGSLILLALVGGLFSALTVTQRQSATSASWQTAEPLMVTAQAIDTSLSDADTTAAASFLKGRLEPISLQHRYQSDLATASADVATAAQVAGSDPAVAAGIRTLSTDLPVYAGIIQEANFNEQQALYPLAAAYLAEANNLMRTGILPAAAQVYGTEVTRLAGDQNGAVSPWLPWGAGLALCALLVVLFLVQRWLIRRFHRTWNLALAAATAVVAVLGVWSVIALNNQNMGVSTAQANGSKPVSTFTEARILALRARADDELTLLTRDADPTYQQDYNSTDGALRKLLSSSYVVNGASDSFLTGQLARARTDLAAYETIHRQIRQDDESGDLSDAVTLASGTDSRDLPAVSADLNGALANDINGSQSTFDSGTSKASSDLDGLVWALAVGTILVVALVLLGLQPRIAEYR